MVSVALHGCESCCNSLTWLVSPTVDHPGVPNPQLIQEDVVTAERYQHRSVAEQKSLDIAMDLLNEDRFAALRATICQSSQEVRRFRQLVVNVSTLASSCLENV
jgi:3'5'-cyclic nucleotide phosphodiesterase